MELFLFSGARVPSRRDAVMYYVLLVAALSLGAFLGAGLAEPAGQPWMALGAALGVAVVYGLVRALVETGPRTRR